MIHWTFRQLTEAVKDTRFTDALKQLSESLANHSSHEQELGLSTLVREYTSDPIHSLPILGPTPSLSLSEVPAAEPFTEIKGSDMPLIRVHLCPGTGIAADRSAIMAGLDTGANIGVMSLDTWRTHESSLRRNSPLLKVTALSKDQTMQGFSGERTTILLALKDITFRVGFCKVTTDMVVMATTPHPMVLGMCFWWVYDLNLEGRSRRLSMLVPKGHLLLQHAPHDLIARRPELAEKPLEYPTRQYMTSDYKPEDIFRLTTRTFKLRADRAAAA